MANIKEIWKKMKYWQKGALCGLVFGILFHIYIFIFRNSIYPDTDKLLFLFLPQALNVFIFGFSSIKAHITISSLISLSLWHFILGSLFGLIYYYMNKSVKNKILGLFLTIIIIIIIIIGIFATLLIVSKAS